MEFVQFYLSNVTSIPMYVSVCGEKNIHRHMHLSFDAAASMCGWQIIKRNMKHMQRHTRTYIYIHAASEAHNGERIVCVCACLCICVENDDDDNAVVLVARTLFFSLPSILACTCIFRTQRSLYTRIHTYKHTERQKTRSNDVHRQRQFVN